MTSVNIGILAHVDAGKTSLTERLLHTAGVIDRIGSVDRGDTQTDSHELERRRGITIRSAVVSFTVGEVKVNLIDTPGHPDFIAEVERALGVLDGVVLVVSAVEGVQAQTRLLMRTLARLRMPVLVFVNKIDRRGARESELLAEIRAELTPATVLMSRVTGLGTPLARASARQLAQQDFAGELAELLGDHDDAFLARYLGEGPEPTAADYEDALARCVRAGEVHPVFFGSALAGTGVAELADAIARLLPQCSGSGDGALRGTVFKIERGWAGERTAYVRLHSGTLAARADVAFHRPERQGAVTGLTGRCTAVEVFERGAALVERTAVAGDIAKLRGLKGIRIGDRIGDRPGEGAGPGGPQLFAPPTLETVIRPTRPGDAPQLYEALQQLADQDPLIDVRVDRTQAEPRVSVSLYGEVQKEVIKATLAEEHQLDVVFEDTRIICVERPIGIGAAVEEIGSQSRTLFWATVGLRVEPGEPGSGTVFRRAVEPGSLPAAFHKGIEEAVRATLQQGLHGWEVLDVMVTLTRTGFASPISTAGDFRRLTPLVLMNALRQAGTQVLEPVNGFELEVPAEHVSTVLLTLAECGATVATTVLRGGSYLVEGHLPARTAREFEQQLPGLSAGEGVLLTRFHGFTPVVGAVPTRQRTDSNPLDRKEYLLRTFGRL
ncbi:TetM/TetW/TetO/TetS family tetracycline resistance ribosomal protection protein [Kitasatospora sp. NBC_01250]|uniref:translation factor GTPase family protein n=1 Tax=Kitasatospora sp. NBC_01250 TaxID=2903571 RepID=UPI002E33FEED|nr:translation factor GTPase family protein [Kitasatospora sp. NBC_01250]